MDPVSLVPVPDVLPAHWLWLHILLTVTAFLHFMAMNIMLGTGCIALTSPYYRNEIALPLSGNVAKSLPYTMAFTINFGVAPLLFLNALYGNLFYTSSILMGTYWLAAIGLLIVTYYSLYIFKKYSQDLETGPLFIGLAVVLLLVVGFLFSNNISLMQMPESWVGYFQCRKGLMLNFCDAALFPRYLHFIASAIAVGGLAIAVYFQMKHCCCDCESEYESLIKLGCNWFTIGTIVNFGIGFWFLGSLPPEAISPATLTGKLFAITLLGSIIAIVFAVIKAQTMRVMSAAVWTLITVFLMTVARDMLRLGYLKPYFNLGDLPVSWQYSPFFLFLIIFGAMGYLAWWMLKLVYCDRKEGE